MLKLIDGSGNSFPLVQYQDLVIESVLKYDDKTLSFSIPIDAVPDELIHENFIRTQQDEFVIKEINTDSDLVSVKAKLNIDELEGTFFENFYTSEQTIKQAMQLALSGTGWTVTSTLTRKRTLKLTNIYVWDIIKQIIETYCVEIQINSINKNIIFVEQRGSDKGTYFISQLNLKSISRKSDTNEFYTRIKPVGKNGLTIESINNGKNYLENYQYSNKVKTYYWKDERYIVAESLKEDAAAKLNDLSKPYNAYDCEIVNLAANSEEYSLLEYAIGDTVWLLDEKKNIKEKQRIVKIIEYPDSPENNNCELANTVLTFDEYTKKYDDTSNIVDNITVDNGTVDGDCIDEIDSSKIINLDTIVLNEVTAQTVNITKQLNAVSGKIGELETSKLSATEADIKYAAIDFANVQKASIGTMLADVGLISSATIVDGHVTGTLGAVQIDAGNITLGILDAGSIEVVNLKAASITVGQINGYQIAPGAIDMNNLAESITNEISSASSNAQTALDEALKAFNKSQEAALAAGTAQATADGKNTVFYQTAAPSGTHKVNDVWFDTDDSNKMYYWNGSAWAARQFGTNAIANASITNALIADATIQSAKIANLDAGKITTGTLNADRIGANTITTIKIAVGDFINYASWKDKTAATSPFTKRNSPWSIDTAVYRTSKASYKFTGTAEASMTEIVIPVNIGEEIYAEFWYKTDSGWTCNTGNSKLRFGSSSGGLLTQFAVSATAQTSWTKVSGTYKVTNSTGPYISVSFNMSGTAAGKSIWIDDITIKKRTTGELIVDGAITTNKLSANAVTADKISAGAITTTKITAGAITSGTIAAGAITADKISAGAVTAAKLSVGNGGNLYATGYDTFENIPNVANQIYYQKSGTAAVSIDTSTAYYGTRCLKIVSTGTDSYVHLGSSTNGYGCIPVIAGKTYIVSVWLKASAKTTAQLYVIGHTAKNNSNSQHTGTTATVENVWTRAYLRYTAISTYPYISIRVDNDTNGTTLWVDAIQVETGTQSQTPSEFSSAGTTVINGARIVTGSITANSIASSAITTDKLTANSITAAKIASGAITADKISAGAVTAAKISVTDLSALKAKIGGWTIASTYIGNSQDGGSIYITSKDDNSPYWIRTHNAANGGGARTFSVSKTGKLYAIDAEIKGNISSSTIESSSFVSKTGTGFNGISGIIIENGKLVFRRYTSSTVMQTTYLSANSDGVLEVTGSLKVTGPLIRTGGIRCNSGFNVASLDSYQMGIYDGGNKLSVKTNVGGLLLESTGSWVEILAGGNSDIWLQSNGKIQCVNTGNTATISIRAKSFIVDSSLRYKNPLGEMTENEANKLLDLRVVKFDYKKGEKNQYGLYAEETIDKIPQCVEIDEVGRPDGIDYSKLIPFLVKKIQMQESKINYLENIITHLIGIAMNPSKVKTYQI